MMFIRYNNKLINAARIREFNITSIPRNYVVAESIERGMEYKFEYDSRELCICALNKLFSAMRRGWQIVNLSPDSVVIPDKDTMAEKESEDDD